MSIPAELSYTREHEWLRHDGDALVVGVTAFAAEQLGAVVYVELPKVGRRVAAGEVIGQIESTKSVSDLYAPVGGEVLRVNDALESTPELVNDDPYGDGWMVAFAPGSAAAADLLDAAAYAAHVAE
jgi:glycine cleavage system H protein